MKRTFVNRIEELRTLNKALKYDGQENPVLVFTGIGGMGKTALRIALEEEILKPKKIPYAVLDYDGDPNLRPIEASLRAIRRQLGRHKVKTPVFDFLYGRYFELSMGVKLSAQSFPPELEGVVNILEGIPFVGNVTQILHGLSQLGLQAKERLQHKDWLYRICDLEPRDILNLLPEVLASDLEEAMLLQTANVLKSSGCRIALLFDAYERISESQLDDTLHRKLFLLTPHLLRVIFTRVPLPWEHKFPKEWQGKITHFPALDDLSQEDASVFLRKKGIDSADLQEHLYQLTGGYPLHLELCADICREITETTQRKPGIPDFQGAAQAKDLTEELVSRLLRQLKDDERDLMYLAVYPRWVTSDVLEVLSSVPESVPRIFKKFIGLSMFYKHAEITDAYVIRKEVRDCLLTQQRKERLWKQRHGTLAKFHKECWDKTQSSHHLREAIYHGFYENSEQAIKIFEEHFWKFLDEYRFAETEGLLEAVPVETLSEIQKRKIDYARARLLTTTARSQQNLITARKLYETLVTTETDEEPLSQYLFHCGNLFSKMSEYEKALGYYQQALSIRMKIFSREHPGIAESYHHIGNIYREQAEYSKALDFYQKSLAIRLKVYEKEHPCVADSYNAIGNIFSDQAEHRKALDYFQKSLTILSNVYGEIHPNVARSHNNIGVICYKSGEYKMALEHHQKSLDILVNIYGEEHPYIAIAYNNMGNVFDVQGGYEKALEYNQKALSIRLKIYGEKHPDVADSYSNIGILHSEINEYNEALKYVQRSLDIYVKVYGEEHPAVANCYNSMGIVYRQFGEYGKALDYYKKSLTIWLKAYKEQHPGVARCYHNIGNVYIDQCEWENALEYHQKGLMIAEKLYGTEHREVAHSLNQIGVVYYSQGKYNKALECQQKCHAVLHKAFSEHHPDLIKSYKDIACTLWALERVGEALEKMWKGLELCRKFKHWKDAIECLEMLAGWLKEKGRTKEADKARTEAQKIRQEHNLS